MNIVPTTARGAFQTILPSLVPSIERAAPELAEDFTVYIVHLRDPRGVRIALQSFQQQVDRFTRFLGEERNGRAAIVLDFFTEGREYFEGFGAQVLEFSLETGCRRSSIVLLQQNPEFEGAYEKWQHEQGCESRAAVVTANGAAFIMFRRLEYYRGVSERLTQLRSRGVRSPDHRSFLALMNKPRGHRVGLYQNVAKDKLLSDFMISFLDTKIETQFARNELIRWERLLREQGMFFDMAAVNAMIPIVLVDDNTQVPYHHLVANIPFNPLASTDIDVITESEMSIGSNRRYTEKTLKSLALGRPIVLFGNPTVLSSLETFGFRFSHPVLRLDYDGILDPGERFAAAYAEIRGFVSLTPNDRDRTICELYEIGSENAKVFYEQFPNKLAESLVLQLIKAFRAPAR